MSDEKNDFPGGRGGGGGGDPREDQPFGAPNQGEESSFRCWIAEQRLAQKFVCAETPVLMIVYGRVPFRRVAATSRCF